MTGAKIGERWRIGATTSHVTSMRAPCFKLAAGDAVPIVSRPGHDLTIGEMTRLYFFDRPNIGKMLLAPELPESWRAWAEDQGA